MPRYFVTFFNPSSSLYEAVNSNETDLSWIASTGEDANGQAALKINKSGKYVSYPIDGPQNARYLTQCSEPDSNLFFLSKIVGPNGALTRIRYVVSGNNTSLSVSVSGNDITVNVATNGSGTPVSTASQVKTAIEASGPATALVDVSLSGLGTGVVNAFGYRNLADGSPAAKLTLDLPNDNSDLTFTANAQGTTGNEIRVGIVVAGNETALSVGVSGKDITINSETDSNGDAVTTALEAVTAVNANSNANTLVTASTPPGSDGTGVILGNALTPLTGGQYGGAVATFTTVAYGASSVNTSY